MGRHSFEIRDERGIQVYRRVQSPRRPSRDRARSYDGETRVSTGVPGLDDIVNGGYFLGGTTVVAGISGVGTIVMGLQYIAEGARRGDRVLTMTLDEQITQVMRNARSIGDFQPGIESGLVRLRAGYDDGGGSEEDNRYRIRRARRPDQGPDAGRLQQVP